jgi:hypothetical protein
MVQEIRNKIMFVYDIDLDNCVMTHEDWALLLAKALAYPKEFNELLNTEYEELIQ